MYLASTLGFIVIQFVRHGSTCFPVRDLGGVVPIEESSLTCAPSTAAASLFVDDSVSFFSASSSLIKKCTTCAGGIVNYYEPGNSQYYTSSESIGSISLLQCSNLCICTSSGICYVKSSATRMGRSANILRQKINLPSPETSTTTTTTATTTRPSFAIQTTTTASSIGSVPSSGPFVPPQPPTTTTTTTTTTTSPISRISLYPYCSDGTCAVYGYVESASVTLVPENGVGVTYSNSDISVPVTNSDSYISVATISCDGCIQSSCQTISL